MQEEEKQENSTNYEEVKAYQEVETVKKEVRTDSYFDGGLLELIGWRILAILITVITLGIAAPWAKCMLYSYQIKHTVYNGKRLKFEGTGGDLFVNIFKWIFFSIITLGIYIFVIPVRKTRWVISNIHYEDEKFIKDESFFDGKTIQLIGVNILCNILTIISFGILYPFAVCYKLKWINKHTVINRKKLVFTGKALSLWGKYILWTLLTIITFGIFSLWIPIRMLKWQTKNVRIKTVDEKEQPKDKSFLIVIPIIVIAILVFSSVISNVSKMSELDWMNLKYNILNTAKLSYQAEKTKENMYTKVLEQKNSGKITTAEMNKLIEKYNLYGAVNGKYNNSTVREVLNEPKVTLTNTKKSTSSTSSSTPVSTDKTSITVGGYTLKFGKYTGVITQFDWEAKKEIKHNVKLILSENTITLDGQTGSYKISGNQIIFKGQTNLLEVTGNNKIRYIVETCPELIYQGQ